MFQKACNFQGNMVLLAPVESIFFPTTVKESLAFGVNMMVSTFNPWWGLLDNLAAPSFFDSFRRKYSGSPKIHV
jgi:hypothetical protein